jgi:hypothetical protein
VTVFAASPKGARLTSDIQDVMHYIIVRRGDFQLYDRLYNAFGERVPVLWDQRRRVAPHANGDDARTPHEDRRHAPPPSWVALGFVVVDRPND